MLESVPFLCTYMHVWHRNPVQKKKEDKDDRIGWYLSYLRYNLIFLAENITFIWKVTASILKKKKKTKKKKKKKKKKQCYMYWDLV